jgi:hypothetical protein
MVVALAISNLFGEFGRTLPAKPQKSRKMAHNVMAGLVPAIHVFLAQSPTK